MKYQCGAAISELNPAQNHRETASAELNPAKNSCETYAFASTWPPTEISYDWHAEERHLPPKMSRGGDFTI